MTAIAQFPHCLPVFIGLCLGFIEFSRKKLSQARALKRLFQRLLKRLEHQISTQLANHFIRQFPDDIGGRPARVRLLAIGEAEAVQALMHELHHLRFAETVEWSIPLFQGGDRTFSITLAPNEILRIHNWRQRWLE